MEPRNSERPVNDDKPMEQPDRLPLNYEYGEPTEGDVQRLGAECEYWTEAALSTDTD